MIDWAQIAEINGLTEEELANEILRSAAVVGAIKIDEEDGDGFVVAKFRDEVSEIQISISRIKTRGRNGTIH